MKKLRNIMLLVAALGMATLFTGCGDDDDNDNNNNNNPGGTIFAPQTAADLQSATKVYTVNVDGNQTEIRFPAAQQYTAQDANGTQTGTTSQPQRNGNVWTFNITPDAGQTNALAGTVELNFTSATAGTYKLTETGSGTVHNGTFTLQDTGGTTNGGTDSGTTNGGTDSGTTNGGTDGGTSNAPTSIDGKTYHVVVQTGVFQGQAYDVAFTGSTFTISNGSEGAGNYTYARNTDGTAHLHMTYTAPESAAAGGDFDDFTLNFSSPTEATFTGTSKTGNVEHNDASGTFTQL